MSRKHEGLRMGGRKELLNQRGIKLGRDLGPAFGHMDMAVRDRRRRERIERSNIEFQEMLALENHRSGLIGEGNQVTNTIVDLTRTDVLSKEEASDRANPLEQKRLAS